MVLRASEPILEKNLRIIRHNLGLVEAFVARFGDLFEWVRPKAGAVAFIKFTGTRDFPPLYKSEVTCWSG
jgi:hypothetical protein